MTTAKQRAVTAALAAQPGTLHYVSVALDQLSDMNTLFRTDTGTKVGDTYPIVEGNRTVTVTIVGEVFQPGNDIDLFTSPQTLAAIDPAANGPAQYSVALKPGVSAQAYANTLNAVLGDDYDVGTSSGGGAALLAVVTLVAGIIAVPAGILLHHGVITAIALRTE